MILDYITDNLTIILAILILVIITILILMILLFMTSKKELVKKQEVRKQVTTYHKCLQCGKKLNSSYDQKKGICYQCSEGKNKNPGKVKEA